MYNLDIKKFGSNLKLYRISRKQTLESLGEKIHKTKATISKYEKGEIIPDVLTILEICNALNISISQLIPQNNNAQKLITKNPFKTDVIYMYYYTEDRLITSILEILEDNDKLKVKYFNGIKDIKKYADDSSYIYEGILQCDKTVGYINLINTDSQIIQLEKVQISFNIPWSKKFDITNFYILALTPNSVPIVKKGILSVVPINDFENFKNDLLISKEELTKIQHNNGWILENKNYNHFFYDM